MPNWCFNDLTITGNLQQIIDVKKQVGAPYTQFRVEHKIVRRKFVEQAKDVRFSKPVFSFWNICKPTDINAYWYSKSSGVPDDPNSKEDWFKSDNWYDWNVRNWGTKWDVANSNREKYPETELLVETDNLLEYKFNTAWSPPTEAIRKLSEQHPKVTITLKYEEETGWGGEIEFINGEIIKDSYYEWSCRNCGYELDKFPLCQGCQTDICPECKYGDVEETCEVHGR